jgi:hypothetical protein
VPTPVGTRANAINLIQKRVLRVARVCALKSFFCEVAWVRFGKGPEPVLCPATSESKDEAQFIPVAGR